MMIETKQGLYSIGDRNGSIITDLRSENGFEMRLMEMVFAALELSGGTVLDIGAHIGVISIAMLYNGQMDRAIAIEPEEKNFSLLEESVRQNGFEDKFVCVHGAVSDHNGILKLALNKNNSGDNRIVKNGWLNWDLQSVPCYTLDTILEGVPEKFRDISLVWIDVQGHEWYIFSEAKDLLKDIPVVSEVWGEGLRLAGISRTQFVAMISDIWKHYWKVEGDKFVRYPISEFVIGGGVDNVIFTQ